MMFDELRVSESEIYWFSFLCNIQGCKILGGAQIPSLKNRKQKLPNYGMVIFFPIQTEDVCKIYGQYIFLKVWFNIKIVEPGLLILGIYLCFHNTKWQDW